MSEFVEKVRRYMSDKPEYRQQNKNYVRYEMKNLSQEDLIKDLKTMNLAELRYVQGAGVPGHANLICMQLIAKRKKEYDEFLKQQSRRPIESVEAEHELSLTTVKLESKTNSHTEVDNNEEKAPSRMEKAISAFEAGRERNSKKIHK
jgi:hypothetical protein